jgi:hypothetical protein
VSEQSAVPDRLAGIFRAGLVGLGTLQAVDGLYALIAPRSFYDDFPFGRGWVAALPQYSEHLVRDVGGLFLATAVVLFAAAIYLERRLVAIALISFLAFSIPHSIFHGFNLGPYSIGDLLANVLGLGATVVVPLLLLYLLLGRRRPSAVGDGRGAARGDPAG